MEYGNECAIYNISTPIMVINELGNYHNNRAAAVLFRYYTHIPPMERVFSLFVEKNQKNIQLLFGYWIFLWNFPPFHEAPLLLEYAYVLGITRGKH